MRGEAEAPLGWFGPGRTAPAQLRHDGITPGDGPAEAPGGLLSGGSLLPGLVDHHVHLALIDPARLRGGAIVEVHDLGSDPALTADWRANPPHGGALRLAGPMHTAPGGYPSGRSWAPEAMVRAVTSVADAHSAVQQHLAAGFDVLKITLHAGMPLLDDAVFTALLGAARAAGLPSAVHAEGPGQAERAIRAGADILVHTPWDTALDDALIAQAAATQTWISTLAIHDGEALQIAAANLARFRAAGGTIRYGTDAGNGEPPTGPVPLEILRLGGAGLAGDALLLAVTGHTAGDIPLARALWSPHPLPVSAQELVTWLGDSRRLSPA